MITEMRSLVSIEFELLQKKELRDMEQIFFREPECVVYILEQRKLKGIITVGDFVRNYPEVCRAINTNCKRIVFSEQANQEAEQLFERYPKIKKLPVVDGEGKLLFEITTKRIEDQAASDDCTQQMCMIHNYMRQRGCTKICVIEHKGKGERIRELLAAEGYEINIILPEQFFDISPASYDVILECDRACYNDRKLMLNAINSFSVKKYIAFHEIDFWVRVFDSYHRMKRDGIQFYLFEAPSEKKMKYLSQKQKNRIYSGKPGEYYIQNAHLYKEELKEYFGTDQYEPLVDMILKAPAHVTKGDISYVEECHSTYMNVVDGYRITTYKKWNHYIHEMDLYGPCIVYGTAVKDEDTIPSLLQDLCNHSELFMYNVNNYGYVGSDSGYYALLSRMMKKRYQKGDVVIFLLRDKDAAMIRGLDPDMPFMELSTLFDELHDTLDDFYFLDLPIHCNGKSLRFIAETIFERLLEDWREEKLTIIPTEYQNVANRGGHSKNGNVFLSEELNAYIQKLKGYRLEQDTNVGAVVMNCNPFTNGHRYLVETAASKVDRLFLFVVEEDRSFFSFEDRLKLVKAGTDDLANVTVLPSSKFMISNITFSEYFHKDAKQGVAVDASFDIEIFAEYIAPALGIRVRFVGEEPIDMVTQQYNETMKRILPNYGIELIEIKRKSIDGTAENVISASKVRKYLEGKQWEQIKTMVPETTYRFLIENFL